MVILNKVKDDNTAGCVDDHGGHDELDGSLWQDRSAAVCLFPTQILKVGLPIIVSFGRLERGILDQIE